MEEDDTVQAEPESQLFFVDHLKENCKTVFCPGWQDWYVEYGDLSSKEWMLCVDWRKAQLVVGLTFLVKETKLQHKTCETQEMTFLQNKTIRMQKERLNFVILQIKFVSSKSKILFNKFVFPQIINFSSNILNFFFWNT